MRNAPLPRGRVGSVNCPGCGHENRESAKFCEACAAPLAPSCASCGTALRPGARFCDECAHPVDSAAPKPITTEPLARSPRDYTPKHLADKILQSKPAPEGERKQLTVMFADVNGSMELAAQLDPEEWHPRPGALLRDPDRGRASLRRHGESVHRRRHHGALRRTDPHGHSFRRSSGRQHRRRPAHGLHRAGRSRRGAGLAAPAINLDILRRANFAARGQTTHEVVRTSPIAESAPS